MKVKGLKNNQEAAAKGDILFETSTLTGLPDNQKKTGRLYYLNTAETEHDVGFYRWNGTDWVGFSGSGAEPENYLKSITKNATNKDITIRDKNSVETKFPYDAKVVEVNATTGTLTQEQIDILLDSQSNTVIYNGTIFRQSSIFTTARLEVILEYIADKYKLTVDTDNKTYSIVSTDIEIVNEISSTHSSDKITSEKALYQYIASGNFGNPRYVTTATKKSSYDNFTQIFIPITANKIYIRSIINKTSSECVELTDKYTTAQIDNLLSSKVNTSRKVNGHALTADVTVTKSDVGLGSVANTGDSATPVSGGTTKFTTGCAYTEFNKKIDLVNSSVDNTYTNRLALITAWNSQGKRSGTFYGSFTTANENPSKSTDTSSRYVHHIDIVNGFNYATFLSIHRESGKVYACAGAKQSDGSWSWSSWSALN